MVIKNTRLLFAKVMHKRSFPRANAFNYGLYYFAVPLSRWGEQRNSRLFDFNRFALFSFFSRDYGACDETHPKEWISSILDNNGLHHDGGEVVLVTLPRILGYAFNPVSFWMCYDKQDNLRTVLCEVRNTFGERHSYLCAHSDGRTILPEDVMTAKKLFHVSPFLEREGDYRFRFRFDGEKFAAWIDLYDTDGQKKLTTSLLGKTVLFTTRNCWKAFLQYPLVTFKVIGLIHFQAIKLFFKKVKYVPKPAQLSQRLSKTDGLNAKDEI